MKLMGLVVMVVMTILTARSCSGSSPTSPLNPTNLAGNGIASACANQAATNAAAGNTGQTAATIISSSELTQLQGSNPAGVGALEQALGGSDSCPTTTIDANSGS
jgi:hypothetical protein